MIFVWFLYLILPLLLTVVVFTTAKKRQVALIALVPLLVLVGLITYFILPSRNFLSILWGNAIYGIIYFIAAFFAYAENDKFRSKYLYIGIPLLTVLTLFCIGGSLHSYMSVKPTWDSIDKTYSKSTEAPTFKRGETPIALSPKTVINRVKIAACDIPNTQYS